MSAGDITPEAAVAISYGRGLDSLHLAAFQPLLEAMLARGSRGYWAALHLLSMFQHGKKSLEPEVAAWLEKLLTAPELFNLDTVDVMHVHDFETAAKRLRSNGYIDAEFAAALTHQTLSIVNAKDFGLQLTLDDQVRKILKMLMQDHPQIVWDAVQDSLASVSEEKKYRLRHLIELQEIGAGRHGLLYDLPQSLYLGWLDEDPLARLPFVFGWIPITSPDEAGTVQWHLDLQTLVDRYPVTQESLDIIAQRLFPTSWSGSLADQLEPSLSLLAGWRSHKKPEVRNWAAATHIRLGEIIRRERRDDDNREAGYLD